MYAIKTPDQRVRVFISSTMNELANERKAASEAIEKLKLTPVLFELGARPHPPKDLYRAYLEQSHIFVGIYWNNYGWIAPGMTISGLEDEYRLSSGKPQLIYVKNPAPQREERLKKLLAEIENSGTVCYRVFSTPAELADLLQNDLALLLSERFEIPIPQQTIATASPLPIMRSSLIGRQRELAELKEMILSPEIFQITITGMGGTGKTRIAIELGHRLKSDFKNGVYYVSLASLTDAQLIAGTIAHSLGLFDNGSQPIRQTLLDYLRDKHVLLLLDNFEQIIEGSTLVAEIIECCPSMKIIVTSRMPLNIRAEHVYPLQPLESPQTHKCNTVEEMMKFDSVQLFVQRAKQVNPLLQLNKENIDAICQICHKLDGLPLAIELAALRTKFFSPAALLSRMSKVLDLLSHGPKDLPARQQALRSTIEWSYNLLDDECKTFFKRLAIFSDGWTMEAAHSVVNCEVFQTDVMDATEKLVDLGLLRIFSHYNEEYSTVEPRFTMLQTVQEYAYEMLELSGDFREMKKRHALYFVQLCEQAEPYFWTAVPDHWFNRLQRDHANLSQTVQSLLELGMLNEAWQFFGAVGHFWDARGWSTEAKKWQEAIGISAAKADEVLQSKTVEPKYVARALNTVGTMYFSATEFNKAIEVLQRSIAIQRSLNDKRGIATAGIFLGTSMFTVGDMRANDIFNEAIQNSREANFTFGTVLAHSFLTEVYTRMNRIKDAHESIAIAESSCDISNGKGWQLALTMLQKGNIAMVTNDLTTAEDAYRRSLSAFTTCFKTIKGWAYIGLGMCYLRKDEFESARTEYINGINSGRETGEKGIVASGILGVAGVYAATGDYKTAAKIIGGVENLYYIIGNAHWSGERILHDTVLTNVTQNLTESELTKAKQEGKNLTMEELLELVMREEKVASH